MYQPDMFDDLDNLLLNMLDNDPELIDQELIGALDEFGNNSGTADLMEAPISGENEAGPSQRPTKRKRSQRHTQQQTQELNAYFKICPRPNEKEREELGRRLSLEPQQVKFWFQNKRTQKKSHHERGDNNKLRNENVKLRAETLRWKEVLSNSSCQNCGAAGLIGENARLREEIDRLSGIAATHVGKPMLTYPRLFPGPSSRSLHIGMGNFAPSSGLPGDISGAADHHRSVSGPTNDDMPLIIERAVGAMEELMKIALAGEPFWVPSSKDLTSQELDDYEYQRTFPQSLGPGALDLKTEATRESAILIMNRSNIVEILLDVNQWSNVFSSIVSKAMTLEVLSTGVAGDHNGELQVMTAEFQMPSPLVPTRESCFLRYCKQHDDVTWAVVDVSLDSLRPNSINTCRRRPSGCLIQELPGDLSKVTWVEHVDIDDRGVHAIYKQLVNSGLGFGARRWVATLDRQSKRLASVFAKVSIDVGVISSMEGRRSTLMLAEKMVKGFCSGVGASTARAWSMLSGRGADDVRVMTRESTNEPGSPSGIVLSAVTSFWLPVPPKRLFEFLQNEHSRSTWDVLSNGGHVQQMAQIAAGRDPENSVSLLRINSANSSQSNMLILQESSMDATGSYVIYAPVNIVAMNRVLSGGDPNNIPLLPSGFAILPDGPNNGAGGGSLLTVALQILADIGPNAKLPLEMETTVNRLIKSRAERIKEAVGRMTGERVG